LAQEFSNYSQPYQAGSTATGELGANRTYTCYTLDDDDTFSLSTTVLGPNGETIQAVRPQIEEEVVKDEITEGNGDPVDTNLRNNFISFTTLPGLDGFGEYTITLSGATVADERKYGPRCRETSQTCSFNTFVNDFNFLEVTNEGSKAAEVAYVATDFDGNTVSDSGVILPGQRADFDIHSKVGASKFGKIVVHPKIDYRYGQGISAKLSQYKGSALSNTESCTFLPEFITEEEER
jgi:hypothetical protein